MQAKKDAELKCLCAKIKKDGIAFGVALTPALEKSNKAMLKFADIVSKNPEMKKASSGISTEGL